MNLLSLSLSLRLSWKQPISKSAVPDHQIQPICLLTVSKFRTESIWKELISKSAGSNMTMLLFISFGNRRFTYQLFQLNLKLRLEGSTNQGQSGSAAMPDTCLYSVHLCWWKSQVLHQTWPLGSQHTNKKRVQTRDPLWIWNPWGRTHKNKNRSKQWLDKMGLGPIKFFFFFLKTPPTCAGTGTAVCFPVICTAPLPSPQLLVEVSSHSEQKQGKNQVFLREKKGTMQ